MIKKKKPVLNIAIDGPAGAGKSTVAKALSKTLGILYLDTGAMYRALALKAVSQKVDINDDTAIKRLLGATRIDVKYSGGAQRTLLDKKDVSDKIREPHISRAASDISAKPLVRYRMVELQREIAAAQDTVLDGRDIGTYVLPKAGFKFYLTARPEVRAHRRYLELTAKGAEDITEAGVLSEILQRDENDSKRAVAPLRKADDAVEIDTSDMDADTVVNDMIKIIGERG